jgi:hypothetical protein
MDRQAPLSSLAMAHRHLSRWQKPLPLPQPMPAPICAHCDAHIRECDIPLDGCDLIPMEHSPTWWNPKPKHAKSVILMPSLISSPQSELMIPMHDFETKRLICRSCSKFQICMLISKSRQSLFRITSAALLESTGGELDSAHVQSVLLMRNKRHTVLCHAALQTNCHATMRTKK